MKYQSYCLATFFSVLIALSAAGAAEFAWTTDDAAGTSELTLDGKPVVRYMFAYDTSTAESTHDTYKVYHHLFGPNSGRQITKGPGGKFTHHRGIYVGWNKTRTEDGKQYDFWHCSKGAHLRHIRFVEQQADSNHGTMTAEIHWNDAEGKTVIRELRTIVVTKETEPMSYRIDWSSKLFSKAGDILLSGDRQHAGFQFRAAQAVADSNGARFVRSKDFPQEPEAIQVGDAGNPPAHINLSWFAQTFELDGSQYTVEYFDNPNLPKPSLFSERPYGRFGTYFSTTLSENEPLELEYRLIVSEGETPGVDAIQQRYDAFVSE